jgi:RHS repeat-associated protein
VFQTRTGLLCLIAYSLGLCLIAFAAVVLADGDTLPGENYGNAGHSISTAGGELYQSVEDLYLSGPLPLLLTRYYSSALKLNPNVQSRLGNNWTHNFDVHLILSADTAKVVFLRGRVITFKLIGKNWVLVLPSPFGYQLLPEKTGSFQFLDIGSNLIYTFNPGQKGRLERIQDRNGNALTLSYLPNSPEQLAEVSDGLGRSLDFFYNSDLGRLTDVRDQTGRNVGYGYAGTNLYSVSSPNGNASLLDYTYVSDRVGLLTAEHRFRGNIPYRYSYDDSGRAASESTGGGNTTTFAYDTPTAGKTTVTDPLKAKSVFQNLGTDLLEQDDAAGNPLRMTYDENHRRTTYTDRTGNSTTYTYHSPSGLLESIKYPDGSKLICSYTATTTNGFTFHDLNEITFPDGTSGLFDRDTAGNVLVRTDRNGKKWRYLYNAFGQVLTATLPSGGVVTFTYTSDGTRSSVQFPGRTPITLGYDALDRMTSKKYSDGNLWTYSYDGQDNLLSVADEGGNVTSYQYDGNGHPLSRSDAEGGAVTFLLSATEQLTQINSGLAQAISFTFDPADRYQSIVGPNGELGRISYDPTGNPVIFQDGLAQLWKQEFDQNGRLISFTTPLAEKTQLSRDILGHVTGISSPLGNQWGFVYDTLERLTSIQDPYSATTRFTYDSSGRLTSFQLPDGASARYTRNPQGQITAVTDPRGNLWQFARDISGRLTSSTDPLGNVQGFERDDRGRITRVNLPGRSFTIGRDPAGHVRYKDFSEGLVLLYDYDGRGLLRSGTNLALQRDDQGRLSGSNGIAIDRDSQGRIARILLAPGKAISYSYDKRDRVIELSDWLGGETRLDYDNDGRLTTIRRSNGVITKYGYDAEGLIVSIAETGAKVTANTTLTRDKRGRVVKASRTVPLSPLPEQLASVGRNYSFDTAYQVIGFGYDTLGRRTSDKTRTYDWDAASRLNSFTENGKTVRFQYDSIGVMTQLTKDGTPLDFVWNYAFDLPSVSIARQGGADWTYYVHAPNGDLLYSIASSSGKRRCYHYDEIGNTLFLSDDGGVITDSYAYSPEGILLSSTGDSDNPFTFAGRYGAIRLGNTNLYSMRLRIYDSATNCFLSRDPIFRLEPNQINPYQYAVGNPVTYFDVTGEGVQAPGEDFDLESRQSINGERRFGGFPLEAAGGRQIFGQMANQVELHSHQNVNQSFRQLSLFDLFKRAGSFRSLLTSEEIVGEPLMVLRDRLSAEQLAQGTREVEAEIQSGRDLILKNYGAAAENVWRSFRAREITEIEKNELLFRTRRSLEELDLVVDDWDEAEILINVLTVKHPLTSPVLYPFDY